MGKDAPDTSGMERAAAGLTGISQQQQDLSRQYLDWMKEVYGYGRQQYEKYTTPVLDEYKKIVGLSPATYASLTGGGYLSGVPAAGGGYTSVGTAGGAPLYYGGGGLYTGQTVPGTPGTGAPGMGGPGTQTFVDPNTGQIFGDNQVTPMAGGNYWMADPNSPGGGRMVQPYSGGGGGTAGTSAYTAYTPWSGTPGDVTWNQGVGYSATTPPSYMNPVQSSLFQSPVFTAGQQADQAKKAIMANNSLGPAQKTQMISQIDVQKMQGLQNTAYQQVQGMLGSLTGSGSTAYSTGLSGATAYGGLASSSLTGAASSMAGAGSLQNQIASLQMQYNQMGNQMMGGIFNTIGTLGGLLGGSYLMGGGGGSQDYSYLTRMAQAL